MKVIRNIIEFILVLVIYDFLIFNNHIEFIKSVNLEMYRDVYNGVKSHKDDAFILVFDYKYITDLVSEKYKDYDYKIVKVSESNFVVKIRVSTMFFTKYINEKIYIKKGEMYEKFN